MVESAWRREVPHGANGGRVGLEFRVLGPLEVVRDGEELDLGPRRQRAVLARLLVERGRPVSVDRLLEDVWGGRPPPGATRTLRSYISRLRTALGTDEVIATRAPGYALDVVPTAVDAIRFEALAGEGRSLLTRRNPPAAAVRLREALSLWRGAVLADLPDEPFVLAEARRLEEQRLAALEDRIDADLASARHVEVVAELEQLVEEHPLRERLWGQLMTALYRSGRQADALAAYQRARTVLVEELGLEPGDDLRHLEASILRHDLPLPTAETPHNLPTALTTFVGREREIVDIVALLGQSRLVTLSGPGGAGKTRVAIEAATRGLPSFADGVWMVDLALVSEPAVVGQAVAAAVGIDNRGGRLTPTALEDHLARASVLLVLDNCEHVVSTCAALVERLLGAGPALRVLATSRESLGVPGEVVYEMPPLSAPAPGGEDDPAAYDAVRLFLDRSPTDVPAASLPTVARICRELDGMPLAIEIAAAQTRLLSPDEIADRLDDRFRLLAYWSRTAVPRHRTLRASIDWSYALLGAEERSLFHRLGVFAGTFTVEAAEAVTGKGALGLHALRRLVDASLVQREDTDGKARFRLLETVRQYARERAAEADEAQGAAERHARFFAGIAARAARAAGTTEEAGHYVQLDAEHANLRAALEWSYQAGQSDVLGELAAGLGNYWRLRCYLDEGEIWLMRAIEACVDAPANVRADLRGFLGNIRLRRNEFDAARLPLEEAVALARVAGGGQRLAAWLHVLAFYWRAQGEFERARSLLEEALALEREEGNREGASHRLGQLADIAVLEGRLDDAEHLYAEAWALLDPAPPGHLVAYLDSTARLSLAKGDLHEAARRAEEGLARARELGDPWHVGLNLTTLACIAWLHGDLRHAGGLLVASFDALWPIREMSAMADALDVCSRVAIARGQPVTAATVAAAAHMVRSRFGIPAFTLGTPGPVGDEILGTMLDAEAYERARAAGAALTPEEAVELARLAAAGRA